jgi:hypothetical protein
MRERYVEDLANHDGPESCGATARAPAGAVEADQGHAATPPPSADRRAGALAGPGRERLLRLSRRAHQLPRAQLFLPGGRPVVRHWLRALRRRGQRHRLTYRKMFEIAATWLPAADRQSQLLADISAKIEAALRYLVEA